MRWRVALLAVLLAGCAPRPEPVTPALWRVEGPGGGHGYLFGTIHSLEKPVLWRAGKVGSALDQSNRIVVEVGNLADGKAVQKSFAEMSKTPGLPPVSARIDPALRPRLDALMKKLGAREANFKDVETWAIALSLARADQSRGEAANGIDRAVIAAADKRPVVELEGVRRQLGIFDALPEAEQRRLLDAVLRDDGGIDNESETLSADWRRGDMMRIEAETTKGVLAEPALREALFTGRNRSWTGRIAAMLARGEHPFVAVGAAHMAGPDGLPAMLAARGYRVTRIQ